MVDGQRVCFFGGRLTVVGDTPRQAMSRAFILEVRARALKSKLSSNYKLIGALEAQLASKNLEPDAATAELDSTKCYIGFAHGAASLMQEQGQNQRPRLSEGEAQRVAAETALATAESNGQPLTSSESALRVEEAQLTQLGREAWSRSCWNASIGRL